MTGLSGAKVIVVDREAIKMGFDQPNRVVQQGEWLRDNAAPGLPAVHAVMPRGYVMEQLEPIPTSEVELCAVVNTLATSVWKYEPVKPVDTPKTLLKLDRILRDHAPQYIPAAIDYCAFIRPTDPCRTHGDPTAENVMLRDGEYVVIDPIPASDEVPDDLAVDVGKLLQSAYGWEEMKGEERSNWTPDDVALHFTTEVFEVGLLWCVVHFIRTLPYVPKEVKPYVIDRLDELLGV